MCEHRQPLLSELLRPQQLGDLMFPQNLIDRLQNMIDTDNVMNMLFYGPPGLGKTSAARLFAKGLGDGGFHEINGSSATGVDYVRNVIERAALSVPLPIAFTHRRLIFIDEAEYMSKQAQGALRKVIEDSSPRCRFLVAVNDVPKIIPALRSRFAGIDFELYPNHWEMVRDKLTTRYTMVLRENEIEFDPERLDQLIGIYYPDLRAIANQVELEFGH